MSEEQQEAAAGNSRRHAHREAAQAARAKGLGFRAIARELAAQGLLSRTGKPYGPSSVKLLLAPLRPQGMPCRPYSPLGAALRAMRVGDTITQSREVERGKVRSASVLSREIGGHATRAVPGAHFTYETFTAITSRGIPIVGVRMTRTG